MAVTMDTQSTVFRDTLITNTQNLPDKLVNNSFDVTLFIIWLFFLFYLFIFFKYTC